MEQRSPLTLSGGEMRRVALASVLCTQPEVLILDEPTAGLDPEGREEMLDLITRLEDFGINAVVSSHVLPDIERTCSWVVMLDGGKVLRSGPLTDLSTTDAVELEILGDPAPVAAALTGAGAAVSPTDEGLLVTMEDGDPFTVVRDALASTGAGIKRMGPRRITLEDIYLERDTDV